MTGMAVLLSFRPIVRYRDRIAQSDGHDAPVAANGTRYQRGLVMHRPPGSPGCRDQLAGDRPGLVRGQEDRDECDLRGVHHAADGIAARRVGREILPLRFFRGYAQLGGARKLGVRSVRVVPGWMQLTVMPWRPICTASVFVRCTRPALRAPPLRLP